MILSMAVRGEEEKNPYGHHPLTIIFLSAGGTIKTDIKLSELPSFIILLVINVRATMKVSLFAGLLLLLVYFFFLWVETPPRGFSSLSPPQDQALAN